MGLDFTKTAQPPEVVTVPDTKNEVMVVESYDIVADREQMNAQLTNSAEVDALVWNPSYLLGRKRRRVFPGRRMWY